MIGLLRFIGLCNAAVWLGAAVFCTVGVLTAINSQALVELFGQRYYPFFSGSITRLLTGRLFAWQIVCAVIAALHMALEWLYLGRNPRRFWVGLLALLFALSLAGGIWLNPKLTRLHRTQHALNTPAEERTVATKSFRAWEGVFQAVNVLMIGGVAAYFWRLTTTEDAPRFVTPVKFRS